ncbi:uncharacterized [Tachysurus ichikawai]
MLKVESDVIIAGIHLSAGPLPPQTPGIRCFNNTATKQKAERKNTYTSGDKSSLSALILTVTINTTAHGRSALTPGADGEGRGGHRGAFDWDCGS